jgi:ribosomal protein S27AE
VNGAPALMAPLCPRCGDPMRLARKKSRLPQGLLVYLCGGCGYVEIGEPKDHQPE